LYTSCVVGLGPSALFNDMTLFIKKKKCLLWVRTYAHWRSWVLFELEVLIDEVS